MVFIELILDPENILDDFSSDVMEQVKNSIQKKSRKKAIFWYAAAAVFIFVFLMPLFQPEKMQINIVQKSTNVSITELIEKFAQAEDHPSLVLVEYANGAEEGDGAQGGDGEEDGGRVHAESGWEEAASLS